MIEFLKQRILRMKVAAAMAEKDLKRLRELATEARGLGLVDFANGIDEFMKRVEQINGEG